MDSLTLLEKAANRLINLVRVRNIYPKGKFKTELGAMHNLLACMDFDIDFFWNDDVTEITGFSISFDGKTIERIA